MNKLLYFGKWGKDEQKAWSGTMWGLYSELNKKCDVERLDIKVSGPWLMFVRILEKLKLWRRDTYYAQYYAKKYAKRYAGREGLSVLQFEECDTYTWADAYIFQDLSVRFVADVYNDMPELIPYVGLGEMKPAYLEQRIESQNTFYRNAAGIFTMSRWLRDYIVEKDGVDPHKVHAVGGGVNVDADAVDYSGREGNKLLFVGRDFERKGGDLVVRAFRLLKAKMPEAELWIAGPETNPIDGDSMCEGIHFAGSLSREELNGLYNSCDVFCMPSRFEAYGLVFAEALVFGLPCIARNAFAMKEMITNGDNGYLIDRDDPAELCEVMFKALQNKEMQQRVRARKTEYEQVYSWDAVTDRMLKVMK